MSKKIDVNDIIGKRFGTYKVLEYSHYENKNRWYKVLCDCGATLIRQRGAISRKSDTCSGNHGKGLRNRNGLTTKYPSEYASWCHMVNRCYNPKHIKYYLYGGRDDHPVKVQPEWLDTDTQDGFANFLKDMGPKPSPEKVWTIERRNPNGHYCQYNCYWIHNSQQAKNRRMNTAFVSQSDLSEYII